MPLKLSESQSKWEEATKIGRIKTKMGRKAINSTLRIRKTGKIEENHRKVPIIGQKKALNL